MTHSPLRLATRADLSAILSIYNASIPAHMSTADLVPQSMAAREAWWEQRNHDTRPVLVTERGGRVVAWGAFTNFKDRAGYAPTAEISVYVDPSAVGSGLGSAMLDELLSCAGSFRARDMQLHQTVYSPCGVLGGYVPER